MEEYNDFLQEVVGVVQDRTSETFLKNRIAYLESKCNYLEHIVANNCSGVFIENETLRNKLESERRENKKLRMSLEEAKKRAKTDVKQMPEYVAMKKSLRGIIMARNSSPWYTNKDIVKSFVKILEQVILDKTGDD